MTTCIPTGSNRESQALVVSSLTKCYYQDAQQAKLIDLQAEIDSLLQKLQNQQHQRSTDAS
ncbi:MAG: hypothetical protein KME21_20295 [Desmonostoc vinosum HA7617-LM4]|jgi:hypothetical protein|nr:hypothetical protein [Desmonostoc vinosum HA7617-LM4]